jgi:quinol monooxygenase YgiN
MTTHRDAATLSGECSMTQLAIIARIEVVPGHIQDVLPLLTAHRDRSLRDEPGTLKFEVLRPRDEDTVILLYELYEDEAAFDVHWNAPFIARFRQEAGERRGAPRLLAAGARRIAGT